MFGKFIRLVVTWRSDCRLRAVIRTMGRVGQARTDRLTDGRGKCAAVGRCLKVTVYGEECLPVSTPSPPTAILSCLWSARLGRPATRHTQLQREITNRYASGKFLQEPQVTVDVLSFRPIFVAGETLRPGAYPVLQRP